MAVLAGEVEAGCVVMRGGQYKRLTTRGDKDPHDLQMAGSSGGVQCGETIVDGAPAEKRGTAHFYKMVHDFGVALLAGCMQTCAAVRHVKHQ